MCDPLPQDLAVALETSVARRGTIGATIHYFSEVGSTNDEASRLAERGAPHGTTVIASAQTSGRGRYGRSWFSPPGAGLYVSVICRGGRAAPYLSLAGGVAAADGIIAATALPVEIKWPNDIVIRGGNRRRKLAGILAEASSTPAGVQHAVLGFGINLRPAAYPSEIVDRVTSLETELGRAVPSGAVLVAILGALNDRLRELASGDSTALLRRWRALSPSATGAAVEWTAETGRRSGRTAGIDDDGALRVSVDGRIERIIAGTLTWI
jgi:BirA family biotin operon repressor/biotin-[acetyl-CoA-carboxylase] ligase